MDGRIKIRNWNKFQHFKNRRPPWIKLYRDLMDDKEWFSLDGESAKFLIMLWLIASENEEGYLPDINVISFRCRLDIKRCEGMLQVLKHWLETSDINMISSRYQDDINLDLQRERRDRERDREETEREGEAEKSPECHPIADPLNPTFPEAVARVKACHPDFRTVPDVAIENALKGQPDRSKWIKAIDDMALQYAGATMGKPVGRLMNFLAGKQDRQTAYRQRKMAVGRL